MIISKEELHLRHNIHYYTPLPVKAQRSSVL